MRLSKEKICLGGFSTELPLRVVIAGGGTGGHVFPGIALAQAFSTRNPESEILFVGTGNAFEQRVFSTTPFAHTAISVEGIKGRGVFQKLRAVAKIPSGVVAAIGILKQFGTQLVIGVGGYSSAPVVIAAWLMGIPIVIQEQNLIPGMANRLLSRLAKQIHTSFAETRPGFSKNKVRVSGNPVRQELISVSEESENTKTQENADSGCFTVLICGGSQGARAINRAVLEALPLLIKDQRISLIHQTGEIDESDVKDAYSSLGISARVKAFFNDMAVQYAQANLVICRSGATTIAELTAVGRPALFIPYPYAADQHQRLNAELLVQAGAAEMILESELTGAKLAERLHFLAVHPEILAKMGARSKAFGRPGAATDIVDDCYRLINGAPLKLDGITD
jgi:UDP-N-acetylglucosamine--N-acetylmuramyl-(pentapeptide) pyrophosphoryl-undecaprenol N-acetylglucosamine transferase